MDVKNSNSAAVASVGSGKKRQNISSSEDEADSSKKQKKPACKYGAECYRKSRAHLDRFYHPTVTVANSLHAKGSQKKAAAAKLTPKNQMQDGDSLLVGEASTKYRIKFTGNTYYCNCPGWKFQGGAPDSRTCKHLKEHLGEEFEQERIKTAGASTSSRNTDSAGVSSSELFKSEKARTPTYKQIPGLLLAHKWTEDVSAVGWWISEKLDGVRAYWDGRSFYSRNGNEFVPPSWFIKDLPGDVTLDGELFGGRKQFQSTVSIVKHPGSEGWRKLKYHIFDAPGQEGKKFEARMDLVKKLQQEKTWQFAVVTEQTKCRDAEHLENELKKVERMGGEGLMIRKPGSMYENCRSKTLLKIKTFHDAEAEVIGHEAGKGRNAGRMGALRCVMESGKNFSVGTGFSDTQRNKPPKIGTIIVYKFQELTNDGIPRFPVFLGEAADKTEAKDAVLPEIRLVK